MIEIKVFAKDFTAPEVWEDSDYDVVGVGWKMEPEIYAKACPSKVLQGNLDPAILYSEKDIIAEETTRMLERFPPGKHIANLGHGMLPDLTPVALGAFIGTIKGQSVDPL